MARRISTSQLRSQLRQAEARQRQGIQRFNSAVRQHNQRVREIDARQRQAIDAYNRAAHNLNTRI